MPPATKRERDVKCVQVEPRKRIKSASPEVRTSTGNSTNDTSKRPGLLACPYYKHDPTEHMECLLRNRLTSTSFVRQHLQRAHRQPTHCSRCGHRFGKEGELDDHVRQARCKIKSFTYPPGLNMDQLMQIRKPPRDLDERGRWNSMWMILFPGEPCPEDPYVGSAQEEILGIARRAVEAASPDTSSEVLQILNWNSVSTIYTRRSSDKTTPPSSQHSWPLTPQSMDGDAPEAITKPPARPFKSQWTTPHYTDSANATYLSDVYDQCWATPHIIFPSEEGNGTVGETQRPPQFFPTMLSPYELLTSSSSSCETDEIYPEFDPDQQTWSPWPSSSILPTSCGSQGFSPLEGTEIIDLTR